jgi:hypothetical protein
MKCLKGGTVTDQETRDRRAKAEEESSRRRVRRVGEPSESRHGVATAAEGGCAKRTRHWTWTLDSAVVALALRTGLPVNIILGLLRLVRRALLFHNAVQMAHFYYLFA